MKKQTLYLTRGAMIAAIYVVMTYAASLLGLSSGVIQFRISEALCILPLFMPESIAGLTIGCLVSNLITGCALWDVIFGSLATLIGALAARVFIYAPHKFKWMATIPTILSNAFIVPFVLIYAYGVTDVYFYLVLTVGIGEVVCAGIGGSVLYYSLFKSAFKRFLK